MLSYFMIILIFRADKITMQANFPSSKLFSQFKLFPVALFLLVSACTEKKSNETLTSNTQNTMLNAADILGNPEYLAMSYGGYRHVDQSHEPTVEDLKEDLHILSAMGIKVLRTYKLHRPHAANLLKAISEIKSSVPSFEMYIMLGIWINCENAFTEHPNHDGENEIENRQEIEQAVLLANTYPDIVKILAVGNEAMVKWAASYYVQPRVILRWVNYLQDLKTAGKLNKNLWITSSDNFASWGGGGDEYHVADLTSLMHAVDYVSLHTYPMHDTHYNPAFWGYSEEETSLTKEEKITAAMERALQYAQQQYQNTVDYMQSLGIKKPVHIGETGWATFSNGHYGRDGSMATDELKEAIYYNLIREWTNTEGISCFYFEAFDEIWKDAKNPGGSENHFGLFNINGQAKYVLWDSADQGVFVGLSRGGNSISKTYGGDKEALLEDVLAPPAQE